MKCLLPGWGGGDENLMNKSRLRKPIVYRWGVVVVKTYIYIYNIRIYIYLQI